MKKFYLAILLMLTIMFVSCTEVKKTEEAKSKVIKISGIYQGKNKFGWDSTISLLDNGTCINEVDWAGDYKTSYWKWEDVGDNKIKVYSKNFGAVFTAKVSEDGIKIDGEKFYRRIQ